MSLFSAVLFAADAPGSRDLEILPRLTDTEIVDYRPAAELERVYPMGSIRKISGQLRFDGQISARGTLTSVTYQLPAEHASDDAFTAAREALQQQGAELLFWCQARDCGESSLWANEVFGNAKLYGADDRQAYLLLRLAEPRSETLVALYSITRGNRRAYLHVEQFESAAPLGELLPTSATLLRQLKSTGKLELPKLGWRATGSLGHADFPRSESGQHAARNRLRPGCKCMARRSGGQGRARCASGSGRCR
ncbi:hypothetical protein PSYMO_04728 [Pseudomonas amygdali pv. mori str. 301020]|uniref:DUF4892 domain-containing protein n=1 Tax=Pseudomonas amygdali pv. mori str. 301020 TaxID=629261 RepID=A0A656G5R6_PSEA0|nr:hypothetical protein PSYMO_04728 [Pseudomonas amygdali pv. mori str. 301020]